MSESKPQVENTESPAKEQREQKEYNRDDRNRGGRGQQNRQGGGNRNAVKYVEQGEAVEETKEQPKKPYVRSERNYGNRGGERKERPERKEGDDDYEKRPPREKKERIEITLETVIPPLPKVKLPQPNDKEWNKKLDDIQDKIDDVYDQMKNYTNEMRNQFKENKGKKEGSALRDILKIKIEDKKKISAEFKSVKEKYSALKEESDDIFDKTQKLRQKMKNLYEEDKIREKITKLKDQQARGDIKDLTEEKLIIKEIGELEKALQFAAPLKDAQKKIDVIKKEREIVKPQMNQAWEALQAAIKEVEQIEKELDSMHDKDTKDQKDVGPALSAKREEFLKQIDELKLKKKQIDREWKQAWDDYYKQQDEIHQIEFMTKIKGRLIRDEDRKKRDEERAKRDQEELKLEEASKKQFHPYQDEIDLCTNLITYLQNLLPNQDANKEKEQKRHADYDQVLQSDEFKKEKLQVVKSKRETENDFYVGAGIKGKKKTQNKKPTQTDSSSATLNHGFETIQYFDNLKIPVPLTVGKLEETINTLQEKKAFFTNLPDQQQQEKAAQATQQTENQETPAEQKPVEQPKIKENKKENTKKQSKPDLNDDREFPTI